MEPPINADKSKFSVTQNDPEHWEKEAAQTDAMTVLPKNDGPCHRRSSAFIGGCI
jgi:hypothetical protein